MADVVHFAYHGPVGVGPICGAPQSEWPRSQWLTSDGKTVTCERCQSIGGPMLDVGHYVLPKVPVAEGNALWTGGGGGSGEGAILPPGFVRDVPGSVDYEAPAVDDAMRAAAEHEAARWMTPARVPSMLGRGSDGSGDPVPVTDLDAFRAMLERAGVKFEEREDVLRRYGPRTVIRVSGLDAGAGLWFDETGALKLVDR